MKKTYVGNYDDDDCGPNLISWPRPSDFGNGAELASAHDRCRIAPKSQNKRLIAGRVMESCWALWPCSFSVRALVYVWNSRLTYSPSSKREGGSLTKCLSHVFSKECTHGLWKVGRELADVWWSWRRKRRDRGDLHTHSTHTIVKLTLLSWTLSPSRFFNVYVHTR